MIKAVVIQASCSVGIFSEQPHAAIPNFELLGTANSIQKGISMIRDRKPNLVFLDIELPDGSGFDVFEATKDLCYEKVILSEDSHYVFKAVRFNVADYLLKPLHNEAVEVCIQKLIFSKKESVIQQMYEENFLMKICLEKIVVPVKNGRRLLKVSEILRVEGAGDHSILTLDNGEEVYALKSLTKWALALGYGDFFRLNSKLLIKVKTGVSLKKCNVRHFVVLQDGFQAVVQSHKLEKLKQILSRIDRLK